MDPRRSETARAADEHVFVRPGTDAFVLLAMVQTLAAEQKIDLGRLAPHCEGLDDLIEATKSFTPERAEKVSGVSAETIRRLARD